MNIQATFDTFNVGKRGKQPNFSWTDYNISLEISNQFYYTKYLFWNIAFFFQIFKSRSRACFPQHQTIPQKHCQDWFLQMPHSSYSSNKCIMATRSYKSSSLSCSTLTMLFKHSTMVFVHTQLNGNPSGNLYLPSSSQSCLYLSVIAVPCCLQSDRRGSAMNCSVIKVNIRAPFESLIFNISRT